VIIAFTAEIFGLSHNFSALVGMRHPIGAFCLSAAYCAAKRVPRSWHWKKNLQYDRSIMLFLPFD
jgi:hypothetical protein